MYKSTLLALAATSTRIMAAPLLDGTQGPPTASEFGVAIIMDNNQLLPLTAVQNGDLDEVLLVARLGTKVGTPGTLSMVLRPLTMMRSY
jgi:hypothetical protein